VLGVCGWRAGKHLEKHCCNIIYKFLWLFRPYMTTDV
jgi:hypothetical protein